jgi:hypothetical protein
MKVKFLRDESYKQNDPEQSRQYKAGETYDLEDDHANRWIRRGSAVEVKSGKASKTEAMVPASPVKPVELHDSVTAVRKAANV